MPYKRKGKSVYKKTNGWTKKGTSKSIKKAKKYLRVLNAVHRGWRPTRRRKK